MESLYVHWQLFAQSYISCVLLAICCAYLGVYIILRRTIFFGMGVIQLAALGVAFAFLLGYNPALCATLTTFMGIIFFIFLKDNNVISGENFIGLIYVAAGAFSLLLINKSALGTEELKEFFYGHILLVNDQQFFTMLATFTIVLAIQLIFFPRILFIAFDRPMAKTLGIKVNVWDAIFYFSLGGVIGVSTKVAGSLLVLGYLIIPATTAIIAHRNLKSIFTFSIIYALLATVIGLYLQHALEFPPAQTIVAVATLILICVTIYKQKRWLLAITCMVTISIFLITQPQNHSRHTHIHQPTPQTNSQLIISTSTTWKDIQKNHIVNLDVKNTTIDEIRCYLQIDGIVDFVTVVIAIKPQQNQKTKIQLNQDIVDQLENTTKFDTFGVAR